MVSLLDYSVIPNFLRKSLSITTPLGVCLTPLPGKGLVFLPSGRIFIFSKSVFLSFFRKFLSFQSTLDSGFFIELNLYGLGFRVIKLGNFLVFKLGFAHYIKVAIPASLHVLGYKKKVLIFGLVKADVKQFTEKMVTFRKPDVYKNKGVQVVARTFRLKVGKQK